MLLPQYWLRQQKLQRALVNYPIYDPPHKVEERLLPKEKALENFQYFIDVRQQRLDFFTRWLGTCFGVNSSLEQQGIEGLLDWAETYVCVAMPSEDYIRTARVFHSYAEPWAGAYAAVNALLDLGIMLGEALIRHRPGLRWQMEWSMSDHPDIEQAETKETLVFLRVRARDIRASKSSECSGFRRPLLASPGDALDYEPIYDFISTYQMLVSQATTYEYAKKMRGTPKALHSNTRSQYLRNWVDLALVRSNREQMAFVKQRNQPSLDGGRHG